MSIRSQVGRRARSLLQRFGLDLVPYADENRFEIRRLRVLTDRRVGLVIDAGANTGQYARRLRGDGYRGRIVSLEPASEPFSELRRSAEADPAWECRRLALGDSDGSAEIYLAANLLSSSLLAMHERHVAGAPDSAYVGHEQTAVARLDSLRGDVFAPGERLFLKLDVQGYEAQALAGATETLAQIEAIECELSLVPLYEGQALFPELVERLAASAFDLIALQPSFSDRMSGKLLQLDGLFVRTPGQAAPSVSASPGRSAGALGERLLADGADAPAAQRGAQEDVLGSPQRDDDGQ